MEKREEDRNEIEKKVLANTEELVLPGIERLKNTKLSREQKEFYTMHM